MLTPMPNPPLTPDLAEARRLLDGGLRLVRLKPFTKQPLNVSWNDPANFARHIDSDATGYGLPLAANRACSVDPDNWALSLPGMKALGFDLESIMAAGVRSRSTRPGSGGRSAFAEEPDLAWLRFRIDGVGTILEFRAGSPNLQDVVPGLVYTDKSGMHCTQTYCNEHRWDELPGLPDDLMAWWQHCSTDLAFLHDQQARFLQALDLPVNLSIGLGPRVGAGTTRGAGVLAFDAPGYRGPYNAAHSIESHLERHGYTWHAQEERWAPPTATGAPGVRAIPGKDGLWQSDHASDPLCGTFDAWVAHVVLDHGGDVEAAKQAMVAERANAGEDEDAEESDLADAAVGLGSEDSEGELDAELIAMKLPDIDPVAFYGPLARVVEVATEKSEATRVGVAIHLITSVAAYFGRPFYLNIGDEKVGLNLFTVQVGPSALARKGTSAALADRRLMPQLAARADRLAASLKDACELAQAELTRKNALAAELDSLREKKARLLALTRADLVHLEAKLEAVRSERTPEDDEARLEFLRRKMSETTLAPSSAKNYEKACNELEGKITAHQLILKDMTQRMEEMARALENPHSVLEALEAEIQRVQSELDQPIALSAPPKWMQVLAEQAGRPVMLTSLSSGEGLVFSIRDDREVRDEQGHPVIEPGVAEKRLFINVSEFGGPLAVMRRQGSTLSEKVRQAYDGTPLSTPSKCDPWGVEQHHICLSGAITPAELSGLLFDVKDTAAAADNGVGNRPMFLYVRRTKLVSRPEPTAAAEELTEEIWGNIYKVYSVLQPDGVHHSVEFPFTEDGAAEWDRCYADMDGMRGSSERANKLHGRITTNARKLAPILAMLAGESSVNAGCVRAAIAWACYASETVDVVASALKERLAQTKTLNAAEKVWRAVRQWSEDHGGELPCVRDVGRATKLKNKELLAALNWLQAQAPALVSVSEALASNRKTVTYLSALGAWR